MYVVEYLLDKQWSFRKVILVVEYVSDDKIVS